MSEELKIISGAQTGADRAGLDAALHLGLDVGGTVPKGRFTDEGPLTDQEMVRYHLVESRTMGYPARTLKNVMDSDGTVVFGNLMSPGTRLTIRYCREAGRPCLENPSVEELRLWLISRGIRVMNVAGNRERTNPGIYQTTFSTLVRAIGGAR